MKLLISMSHNYFLNFDVNVPTLVPPQLRIYSSANEYVNLTEMLVIMLNHANIFIEEQETFEYPYYQAV